MMSTLRLTASRVPVSRMITSTQTRALSSQGTVAVEKLRCILNEYRESNYSQELPSRFHKDIVRVAAVDQSGDRIALDGLARVLMNIGAQDRISAAEMKIIFEELGRNGEIPAKSMVQML